MFKKVIEVPRSGIKSIDNISLFIMVERIHEISLPPLNSVHLNLFIRIVKVSYDIKVVACADSSLH